MTTKKIAWVITLFVIITLCGCGTEKIIMDQPAKDGNYHYSNRDLGFAIVFPPEFEYYQTQRISELDYIDIEFYVPTTDKKYPQLVPGYAQPVTIRIYTAEAWAAADPDNEDFLYDKIGEEKDKVYSVRYWDWVPADWVGVWSEDMKRNIINSFEII